MGRSIGEQANLVDTQIRENLATQTNLSQGPPSPIFVALPRSLLLLEDDAIRVGMAVDCEAARTAVQVHERATTGFGDRTQRTIDQLARVSDAEDILGQRVSVDPDE